MQSVRADLHDARLRVEHIDERREITAQRRLTARKIEIVEPARELGERLGRDLELGLRGILPDVAHLAARIAAERWNDRQIHETSRKHQRTSKEGRRLGTAK